MPDPGPGSSADGNGRPSTPKEVSALPEEALLRSPAFIDVYTRLGAMETKGQQIQEALGAITASLDALTKNLQAAAEAQATAAAAPPASSNLEALLANAGNLLMTRLMAPPAPPAAGAGLDQAAEQLLKVGQTFVNLMATLDKMRANVFRAEPRESAALPAGAHVAEG